MIVKSLYLLMFPKIGGFASKCISRFQFYTVFLESRYHSKGKRNYSIVALSVFEITF